MKKMSLTEFESYCSGASLHNFCFDSSNQKRGADSFVGIKSSYKKVWTSSFPDTICFTNSDGAIWFDRVKYVGVGTTGSLGTPLTIVCGNRLDCDHDRKYTVLAR